MTAARRIRPDVRPGHRPGKMFVVSAPSGTGKTTLCRDLSQHLSRLHYSISCTTRTPRPGEVHGQDYLFAKDGEFRRMEREGALLESAQIHGSWYGTPREPMLTLLREGTDVILDIDVQGARRVREAVKDGVYIYLLPPSLEVLSTRLQARRSESPEQIARRLQAARQELAHVREYTHAVVNDDYPVAMKQLEAIVLAERARIERMDPAWVERLITP